MATVDEYAFPPELWYDAREHLWVRPDTAGAVCTVGVDALGQEALGDVVYVDLTGPGREVRRGDALGSLEAEKMVRPVLAPVSGTVVEINDALLAAPRLLNSDPYGAGWLVTIRASRWDSERAALLHGDDTVAAWARAELDSHR